MTEAKLTKLLSILKELQHAGGRVVMTTSIHPDNSRSGSPRCLAQRHWSTGCIRPRSHQASGRRWLVHKLILPAPPGEKLPWVAEIVGADATYTLSRKFVRGACAVVRATPERT